MQIIPILKNICLGVAKFSKAYCHTKPSQTLPAILWTGMGLRMHSELNTVALIEI